jgi:glycine betaine/proline transport system ATP-binding protein
MADRRFGGIKVRHLYKIFGPNPAAYVEAVQNGMTKGELNHAHGHVLGLRNINMEIRSGCIQVIMGLSGSGKSTLIRHINRLIDPTAGEILVDGVDVVKMNEVELRNFRRHQTAMVFQKFALLPHRNVLDNTVFGLEVQGIERAQAIDVAMKWLERVGLKGFEQKYPNQLSGGMQQRVGLARALSNDAPVLLMDEAYSALDPLIRHPERDQEDDRLYHPRPRRGTASRRPDSNPARWRGHSARHQTGDRAATSGRLRRQLRQGS